MKAYGKIIRKYYKYEDITFVQPPLTSDGVLGGDRFAVYATTNGGSPDFGRGTAWGAAYPQTGSYNTYSKGGAPTTWYTLYTPLPTLITSCSFHAVWGNYADSYMYITFESSTDNSNWVTLYPRTTLHEGDQTLTFTNTTRYNYYRLTVGTTGGGNHDGILLSQVQLIGQERTVTAGTENDYDFYKDVDATFLYKTNTPTKYYAFKSWEKGQYYGN